MDILNQGTKQMNDFYVVAYEAGAGNTPVPTFASEIENPMCLEEGYSQRIERINIQGLPEVFQLLEVVSSDECDRLVAMSESLGYTEDAAISLPRTVRHNQNLVWIIDDTTHDIIWERCKKSMDSTETLFQGKKPLGLNKRFRFYKYEKGDFFKAHTDGAWPGSGIVDRKLIANVYPDRYSKMTFLLFLSDDYSGGETEFFVEKHDGQKPAKNLADAQCVPVRTPKGGVLCFPHGEDPLHCIHSSAELFSGSKYIIRTDVLFEM